uniref:Ig-like domain-containing protein n=1 Tax=Ursus americanus TaxID=9643 RepID=A0A452Q9D1_URSAM
MLFLQILLLAVLLPDGDSEDAFQELISFGIILTTSFYNISWTKNQGSAWLDELQTHAWGSKTGELKEMETIFYRYSIRTISICHNHVSDRQFEYPFQVQVVLSCDSHFGEASVGFMRIAYQGSDLMSFQSMSWWPSPKGGSRAEQICRLFNQSHVTNEIAQKLLSDTCPWLLLGLLDAGKAYLQRQVRPEAWLSAGPSPGPSRLLLVCHVSSFHPKPVWVMWMWGEQEQRGTQRGDMSLDVKAREAAGLSCLVSEPLLKPIFPQQPHSMGLVFLAVIVPLVLLAGLALWLWKCWYVSGATFLLFPMCLPIFSLSSPLVLPVPFSPAVLTATCCRKTPLLFLSGKHTGDLSAFASLWNDIPPAQGPGHT